MPSRPSRLTIFRRYPFGGDPCRDCREGLNSCPKGEDLVIASLDVEPYVGPAWA